MAITETEKVRWEELNGYLTKDIDGLDTLDFIFARCGDILYTMFSIVDDRRDLDNKKPGVGVRGMRDILSGAELFGKDVKVNGENFGKFYDCLLAISELSRGGFLWIGSSALSKGTQKLCRKAAKMLLKVFVDLDGRVRTLRGLLDEDSEIKGEESKKSDKYGTSGEWEKVNKMTLDELDENIKSLRAEIEKLKTKSANTIGRVFRRYIARKKIKELNVENEADAQVANTLLQGHESEKRELIVRLVECYLDQEHHVVAEAYGNWPLVTDSDTLSKWKAKDVECYEGEFSIKYSEKKYSICVYKLKCKDYNTKKDFDGPKIVKKLDEWSNKCKDVIVVDDYENE